MPADDPRELGRRVYQQNLWLRDLLTAVAEELERLAGRSELAAVRDTLHDRAMRIRRHLHESKREL